MHSANVIHRDLKPSNLLLVTSLLPRIRIAIYKSVILGLPEAMLRKKKTKQSML